MVFPELALEELWYLQRVILRTHSKRQVLMTLEALVPV